MIKCSYCEGEIPKDRYMRTQYKLGLLKGYCCGECKNRAGLLRQAIINPKKYMPKTLGKHDKRYMQDYVNELSLSPEEAKGCN